MSSSSAARLAALAKQIETCRRCSLYKQATHAVPGAGNPDSDLMFIGEAPGFHEDQQGRPFIGAAGSFLDQLLASISLSRQDVYIANIIKCRPPNNRDPQPDEIEACRPYLDQQIALIKPKVIVTLGRFSMQLAFKGVTITKVHGTPKKVGDVVYFPMFHPAAALHQPRYRTLIEQDFQKLPKLLAEIGNIAQESNEPEPPEQLALF